MRRVAVLLAALCVFGVTRVHADRETFAVLVRLHIDRALTDTIVPGDIEEETASLWRPYGVDIEWADARALDTAADGFSMDAIVQWQIQEPASPDGRAVLGTASVDIEALSRKPIRVSFDATQRVAARGSRHLSPGQNVRDPFVARALGRVLAHEIGHVLLAAPYHDADGLMRAAFSPEELVRPDRTPFRLACNGVARLSSRIRLLTRDPDTPLARPAYSFCRSSRSVA